MVGDTNESVLGSLGPIKTVVVKEDNTQNTDKRSWTFYVNTAMLAFTGAFAIYFWFDRLVSNWTVYEWYVTFVMLILPAHAIGLLLAFYVKTKRLQKRGVI